MPYRGLLVTDRKSPRAGTRRPTRPGAHGIARSTAQRAHQAWPRPRPRSCSATPAIVSGTVVHGSRAPAGQRTVPRCRGLPRCIECGIQPGRRRCTRRARRTCLSVTSEIQVIVAPEHQQAGGHLEGLAAHRTRRRAVPVLAADGVLPCRWAATCRGQHYVIF